MRRELVPHCLQFVIDAACSKGGEGRLDRLTVNGLRNRAPICCSAVSKVERRKGLEPARAGRRRRGAPETFGRAKDRAERGFGAEERTRTFTPLRAPAPQAGASANSATSAWLEAVGGQ